jgi:hypothetical protein
MESMIHHFFSNRSEDEVALLACQEGGMEEAEIFGRWISDWELRNGTPVSQNVSST